LVLLSHDNRPEVDYHLEVSPLKHN
jgi:hypothetical protein